jgi:GTP-binding protein EngB required for normal cell division
MTPDGTHGPLADCAARVGDVCRRFRIDSLRPQLAACEELLQGGGVMDVAVLGQFKAGKSSFLNALVGEPVLPVDVLPSTAVVTRIGHGAKKRAVVRGLDGDVREIPLHRIGEFVTERGNPSNGKKISVVDVELPSLAAYEGIRFVDTPGLGSVFAHNTRVAKDWMPRAGAALVAVSVNHPLSGEDLLLLEGVSAHTPEAAILLTKADLVSETERDAVIEFIRRQAARATGREWRILPVSDRPGFEGMRENTGEYLRERIAQRREEAFEAIARHKISGLAAGCRAYLLLAQRSAEAAEAARGELLAALARERRGIGAVVGEIGLQCRHLKAEMRTAVEGRFQEYRVDVAARLAEELRGRAPGWRGSLARVSHAFEAWLSGRMTEEMGSVSLRGEGYLAGFLFRAQGGVSRAVRAFQDRLAREIENALGFRLEGARFDARVEEPARPDVRLSPVFDTHFELLWFLIPMPVFRPLVQRHFLRRIPWEAEKNLSRVAAQWADAAGEVIDGLAREAGTFIERELSTIEGLAGAPGLPGSREDEIRGALEEISSVESALS